MSWNTLSKRHAVKQSQCMLLIVSIVSTAFAFISGTWRQTALMQVYLSSSTHTEKPVRLNWRVNISQIYLSMLEGKRGKRRKKSKPLRILSWLKGLLFSVSHQDCAYKTSRRFLQDRKIDSLALGKEDKARLSRRKISPGNGIVKTSQIGSSIFISLESFSHRRVAERTRRLTAAKWAVSHCEKSWEDLPIRTKSDPIELANQTRLEGHQRERWVCIIIQ